MPNYFSPRTPKYQNPMVPGGNTTSQRGSISMGELRRPGSVSIESLYDAGELHRQVVLREMHNQHYIQFVPPDFTSPTPPASAAATESDSGSIMTHVQSIHPTLANGDIVAAPESPVQFTQSTPNLPPAVAWTPIIRRSFLCPNIVMSAEDEAQLRQDTREAWADRRDSLEQRAVHHPRFRPTQDPVIIWANVKEGVFELKSLPSAPLEAGDEIECFGLLVGTWRLTETRTRHREWGTKKNQRHQEWVYVRVESIDTAQVTDIKMPAYCYYPPSFTMRMTSSIRKLGSMFTKKHKLPLQPPY
ncbi:hypothetical protein C8F04DRAFT_1194357 [Mycena alexandri]|uniref:Uncharacterized protein n=1 Tax=Mycena alexandri TaxID=1745969 RepID=A0AAD6RX73_9AGAR|nr:hypothetical protein C8F04DRAFT_1280236 [Mycena alexandri]KAJ7022637.1 hypothetical protein C8F04DRAFT_1194357 [Mycena alexandri]